MSDRDYLYGHVCAHGSLARSCQVCDLQAEVRQLREERDHYRGWISAMYDDEHLWRDQGEARLRTNVRMTLAGALEPDLGGTVRGTGGNHFIPADATIGDLERAITDGLIDLDGWADETGRLFDPGAVTIQTKRIRNGRISVKVAADLARGDHDE